MHILALSRIDCAAAGYFLSRAINYYTEHQSRMVRLKSRNAYDFPTDIVEPSEKRLRALWDWADVIHVHDFAWPSMPQGLGPADKPTVVTYHGTAYRMNYPKHDRACRELGWIKTASTIDLTLISGAYWMPDTRMNIDQRANSPPGFRVIHAPTNRHVKDTEAVLRALRRLKKQGIALDLIEDVPYKECLERKAKGHVLVDQFALGYGCNAIEAWALGLVVVAHATDEILEAMRQKIGYVPFVESPLDRLGETILRLKSDRAFYNESRERGVQFWRAFHRPEVVAAKAIGYYERAMAQYKPVAKPHTWGYAKVRYLEKHSGLQTFRGPRSNRRYEFGGPKRVGEVDQRDLTTGDSRNPGFLEMTDRAGRRLFKEVK